MNMKTMFFIGIGLVALAGVSGALIAYTTTDTLTAEIVGTERIVESSGDSTRSKYLLYTSEETVQNVDSIWHLKFDSSDFQREFLQNVGNTCTFSVYGFRVKWMSMYRNVYKINCGGTEKSVSAND